MLKILRIGVLCWGVGLSPLVYAELMDPTRPADFIASQALDQASLQVTAIVYSPKRKIAVINGEPIQEQQTFLGNRVTAIHANTVQLDGPNGRITLDLVKQPVKKSK